MDTPLFYMGNGILITGKDKSMIVELKKKLHIKNFIKELGRAQTYSQNVDRVREVKEDPTTLLD